MKFLLLVSFILYVKGKNSKLFHNLSNCFCTADANNLTEWTEAVKAEDKSSLLRLKEEVADLMYAASADLDQVSDVIQPIESYFEAYKENGLSVTDSEKLLALISRLPDQAKEWNATSTLKKLQKWFTDRKRKDPVEVTPSCNLRETLFAGNILISRVIQAQENLEKTVNEVSDLLHKMGDCVSVGEKVGRLGIAYHSEVGSYIRSVDGFGGLVIVIINIGSVND